MSLIHIVIFSKDRPFQLRECLYSMYKNLLFDTPATMVVVTVLYTSHPCFTTSYDSLKYIFKQVEWRFENDFADDLVSILSRHFKETSSSTFIQFLCDDAVFVTPVRLHRLVSALTSSPVYLAIHLALAPSVTYCHPRDDVAILPPLIPLPSYNLLAFIRLQGTHMWNYPWDLFCSIYRYSDVMLIIKTLIETAGISSISSPNRLEVSGCTLLMSGGKEVMTSTLSSRIMSLCLPSVAVVGLTVNRVQDIYENRIYDDCELSVSELDSLLRTPLRDFETTIHSMSRHHHPYQSQWKASLPSLSSSSIHDNDTHHPSSIIHHPSSTNNDYDICIDTAYYEQAIQKNTYNTFHIGDFVLTICRRDQRRNCVE